MFKRVKRYLYLAHRWLGIAMCLLFALWFASGIVLMYVPYPTLTEEERIAALPPLSAESINMNPTQALALAGFEGAGVVSLRLDTLMERPAYEIMGDDNRRVTVFADNGAVLAAEITPSMALAVVASSGFGSREAQLWYGGEVEMDQWTVSPRYNNLRPLHKVILGDADGTVVYVSDVNGRIVLDTHRSERFWNWVGATIHWIYPLQLRRHSGLWADVVIWLSVAGLLSIVTGSIIGVLRLRLRTGYRGGGISPYQDMRRWHHLLGLVSVVFLFTFMFSGLMSMSPWGLFASSTSSGEQILRYQGGLLGKAEMLPDAGVVSLEGIREVNWRQVGSTPYLDLIDSTGSVRIVAADGSNRTRPEQRDIVSQSLPALLAAASVMSISELAAPDAYYYSRPHRQRPLPVLRVKFDDPESTWYHVDPWSGQVMGRLTRANRVQRWLYNGLHSLDFRLLLERRPLWDIVMVVLMLLGFLFAATSVVIGWRRLRRSLRMR